MAEVTKTLKSSGGDYSDFTLWESGEQADLVTATDNHVLECYNDWPSGHTMTDEGITGWTTNATYDITIKTPAAERHNGTTHSGFYFIASGENFNIINDCEEYVNFIGIEFDQSWTNRAGLSTQSGSDTADWEISKCLFTRCSPAIKPGQLGTGSKVSVWNNIMFDNGNAGFQHGYGTAGNTYVIYNNTICDTSGDGIEVRDSAEDVDLYMKNNICNGNTTDYDVMTFDTESHSNNISEDATSPDVSYRSKAVTFENEGGNDFHLGSGDTNAKDAGVDLSTDGDGQLSFSDDIDDDTRSGSWDIGADELVSAGIQILRRRRE
jgi:hypothetical protein